MPTSVRTRKANGPMAKAADGSLTLTKTPMQDNGSAAFSPREKTGKWMQDGTDEPKTQDKPQPTPASGNGEDEGDAGKKRKKKAGIYGHHQPIKLGISISKCPADWRPEGMNTVTINAKLYHCVGGQGWVHEGTSPAMITFTLYYVSNMPGICMNAGKSTRKDLWFPKDAESPGPSNSSKEFKFDGAPSSEGSCEPEILGVQNPKHDHHQKIWTKIVGNDVNVVVRSEDFGAWGWIEASAEGYEFLPPRDGPDDPVPCPPTQKCCSLKPGTKVANQLAYYRNDDSDSWHADKNKILAYWAKIPRDDNNNNIPDDMTYYDDTGAGEEGARKDENEFPSGDGSNGDGFTVYEEYRGFIIEDGSKPDHHKRTDSVWKTVFVYLPKSDQYYDQLRPHVDGPGAYFRQTGLDVYVITAKKYVEMEADGTVEVNKNRGWARGTPDKQACAQHAIWLQGREMGAKDGQMYGRVVGYACWKSLDGPNPNPNPPLNDAEKGKAQDLAAWMDPDFPPERPGTPGDHTHICINVPKCQRLAAAAADRLNQIVAHELGHAVKISHHGEGGFHVHADGTKACWRALLTSGDVDCVMRYDSIAMNVSSWCEPDPKSVHDVPKDAKDGHIFIYPNQKHVKEDKDFKHLANSVGIHAYANDVCGKTYCSAPTGTGANVDQTTNPPARDDAVQGNCAGQIKVKDW
jgi:hypothetical protein